MPQEASRFAANVCESQRHSSIEVARDPSTALRAADLILFATVAPKPHVSDPSLFAHCPTVLHISLRDLAPEIILQACNIVDDVDHVMHADTSPHLAEKLSGNRDFVAGTLADVVVGSCPVGRTKPVIFSPFGLGLLDVALGRWVYDRAVEAGEHCQIGDFFYDLDR